MGKLIYLDHFRLQEPDLPPLTLCGGLRAPYVVDPSVPSKTCPAIVQTSNRQENEPNSQARSKVSALRPNQHKERARQNAPMPVPAPKPK